MTNPAPRTKEITITIHAGEGDCQEFFFGLAERMEGHPLTPSFSMRDTTDKEPAP